MVFVHEDPDFGDLLLQVSREVDLDASLVEKDYWVTHTLWSLVDQGFDVWFKGGTSLSKGFGLIQRFSEDLELRIDPGSVGGLSLPTQKWTSTKKAAVNARDRWFDELATTLVVDGCTIARDPSFSDDKHRAAGLAVHYPSRSGGVLPEPMRPFVLLEVGQARVVPCVARDFSSWIHDELVTLGQHGDFVDNRPRAVRCVHPLVTVLEKLDALARRFPRSEVAAATFVRHYEDIVRVLDGRDALPALDGGLASLVPQMLASRDLQAVPPPDSPAFTFVDGEARWYEMQRAWDAIAPMFWGPRTSLPDACERIRAFVAKLPRPMAASADAES
jgi:hypothetical protein